MRGDKKCLVSAGMILLLIVGGQACWAGLQDRVVGDINPQGASLPIEGACTSFLVDNGGQSLFGTNYDNQIWEGILLVNKRGVTKTGWEASTDGKYARWRSAYGSLTFNVAGTQMPWAGMNEAGLAISTMWLGETRNPAPDDRPPLVSPLWIQYQLDTSATLAEVAANDARVRIADTVDHYLVCERSGDCMAVEFLDGKTVFHRGEGMPIKVLTNHPYRRSVLAWQAGQTAGHNALERFDIAAGRMVGFQPELSVSPVEYVFQTLEQASGQATGGSPTQWSIVFDLDNLQVHFHTSRNRHVRSLDFTRLDFDCTSPAETLDVHAPLSGDISDRLERFTYEDNYQRTLNFLEKWGGMELSAVEVEVLERGLTSFPCQKTAAPYQDEKRLVISPLVGWVGLALFHRMWPLGIMLSVGIMVLGLVVRWARLSGKKGDQ